MRNLLPLFLVMALSWSCSGDPKSADPRPDVTISIAPLEYFVRELAGDRVDVHVMVPDGASPATYEPTVKQLKELEHSSLYLGIGYLGFELGWMERLRSINPQMKVCRLAQGMDLISGDGGHSHGDGGHSHGDHQEGEHRHSGTDPHIWMSVRNASLMSAAICEELCHLLPGHDEVLRNNLADLQAGLDSLDVRIGHLLESDGVRSFMIYHPALAYYARDYGLLQIPLEYEGKEPSPAYMRTMTDRGRELGINTIMVQRQFDRRHADVLAAELDADVVVIDPLDGDWEKQLLHITQRLKASW